MSSLVSEPSQVPMLMTSLDHHLCHRPPCHAGTVSDVTRMFLSGTDAKPDPGVTWTHLGSGGGGPFLLWEACERSRDGEQLFLPAVGEALTLSPGRPLSVAGCGRLGLEPVQHGPGPLPGELFLPGSAGAPVPWGCQLQPSQRPPLFLPSRPLLFSVFLFLSPPPQSLFPHVSLPHTPVSPPSPAHVVGLGRICVCATVGT